MAAKKITSFTNLDAWKQSHRLVVSVFKARESLSRNDSLRNQMERCAVSITLNIAEGFGRQTLKDKKHFYIIARGSIFELQNQLLTSRDTKRFTLEKFHILAQMSLDSIRLQHGLIRSVLKKLNANS